jgi:hypothetical protein
MQNPDLEALISKGAKAHRARYTFFDNPVFEAGPPFDTKQNLFDSHDAASAWASGWMRQDEGRDKSLAALLNVRYW